MTPVDIILYLALLGVLLIGLIVAAIGSPGIWIMAAGLFAYEHFTHQRYFGWAVMGPVLGLAVAAEVFDFLIGSATTKSARVRLRGKIGGMIGGLLGGSFLTFIIPVFPLGTIAGICLGCFLGAMAFESTSEHGRALHAGVGVAKARFLSIVTKLAFAVLILVISVWAAFPIHPRHAGPAAPKPPAVRAHAP
jgi:uncharacterized protein YqgC (DUF456 family)